MTETLITMAVLPLMAAVFLMPGVLLTLLIGVRRLPLLSAVILGYAWLLSWSIFARVVGLSVAQFSLAFLVTTLALLLLVVWQRETAAKVRWRYWSWVIAVCSILLVYLLIVGPYDELPADVYQHMNYMSLEYQQFLAGEPGRDADPQFIFRKAMRHWYVLHAGIAWLVGLPPHQLIGPMGAYHSLVLVAVLMVFALHQFSRLRWSRRTKLVAVIAVGAFFVLQFGLHIFSYIRYYAIAPTIGAYALFLSGLVLYVEYLNARQGVTALFLAGLAGLLAALLHPQQTLFLGVMGFVVTLVLAWDARHRWQAREQRRVMVFAVIACTGAMLVFFYAFTQIAPRSPAVPMQIPLQNILPFVRHLYIPNPTWQIFQVVTVWGMLVLLLACIWRAELKSATILRATLWSLPLVIFNPFFTSFFLRFAHPEVLWRIAYMLPLAALGGFALVRCIAPIRPMGVAIAAVLIFALTPFDLRYLVNDNSKWHMLQSVPSKNTWRHWQDLVDYLNNLDGREQIITDPLTGYVIVATTTHQTRDRAKFMAIPIDYRLANEKLSLKNLRRYDSMLLIVNNRPGGWSKTGEIGRHWRPDELNPSRHYSDAFRTLLAEHPEAFVPLWENNGVTVYRVDID